MEKHRYRVLHIFSGYGGGISSLILNLIENMEDDFESDVMSFSFKNGEEFIEKLGKSGSNIFEMPRPRVDGYSTFKSYIVRVMADNHYDAVHCHIAGWSMLPFYRAAKRAGIKNFFLHAHTTTYDRKIDRLFPVSELNRYVNYKCASVFFTCSDLAADYIYGKYQQYRPTYLIPNGIEKDKFIEEITKQRRDQYKKEFGIEQNETILLHVGRFTNAKNHDFILRFISELKNRGNRIKLLFVGDGELLDDVKRRTIGRDLQDDVLFLGRRLDISNIIQLCDIMILPSLYEGLPTVAVECQATGTPMLLANHITRQCDMGIGLLEFLPIDTIDPWIKAFDKRKGKIDHNLALVAVEKNGFTSKVVGQKYCERLRELIDRMR